MRESVGNSVYRNVIMKVQTLSAVTLHATAACTHDTSIVGLSTLHLDIVRKVAISFVLHVSASRYACVYIGVCISLGEHHPDRIPHPRF